MNRRKILTGVICIILVTALVLSGTVIAYMFKRTKEIDKTYTPAKVSCEVQETFDGERKTSITVQNTGNIAAYIRVRIVSYWVDSDGKIAAKPSEAVPVALKDNWIKGGDDTYYYQEVVKAGDTTKEMLSSPIELKTDENGYTQVIEIFAEAIQSDPVKAVKESWNVTVDKNGRLEKTSKQ